MPVEITMSLSPALQAVADARENVRKLGYKVEDLKTALKAAKSAWEEAVEELNKTLDEMIEGERSPNLFSGLDGDGGHDNGTATGGPENPNPPAPAGQPVNEGEPNGEQATVTIVPTTLSTLSDPSLEPLALPPAGSVPSWRAAAVTEHIDGPGSLFNTFSLFNVNTMGDLADTLLAGNTFNLDAQQVEDLRAAIEDVSQEDERPIKFDRSEPVAVTVKEESVKVPAEQSEKPTKKGRGGRKKKEKEQAGQPAAAEPVIASEPVEADPVEPEAESAGKPGYDEL